MLKFASSILISWSRASRWGPDELAPGTCVKIHTNSFIGGQQIMVSMVDCLFVWLGIALVHIVLLMAVEELGWYVST
jgi:hypothetical protein